jgi:hypothetical protein
MALDYAFGDPRRLFELWKKLTGENLLEPPQNRGSEELVNDKKR